MSDAPKKCWAATLSHLRAASNAVCYRVGIAYSLSRRRRRPKRSKLRRALPSAQHPAASPRLTGGAPAQMLGGPGAPSAAGEPGRAAAGEAADDLADLALLPAEEAARWRRIILCARPPCAACALEGAGGTLNGAGGACRPRNPQNPPGASCVSGMTCGAASHM